MEERKSRYHVRFHMWNLSVCLSTNQSSFCLSTHKCKGSCLETRREAAGRRGGSRRGSVGSISTVHDDVIVEPIYYFVY